MTYLEKAKEMLKDAPYPVCDDLLIANVCPYQMGLEKVRPADCANFVLKCHKCWNREQDPKKPKTRMEVFLERFPNAYVVEGCEKHKRPGFCVEKIFGKSINCNEYENCTDCWNEPAPAEYQDVESDDER